MYGQWAGRYWSEDGWSDEDGLWADVKGFWSDGDEGGEGEAGQHWRKARKARRRAERSVRGLRLPRARARADFVTHYNTLTQVLHSLRQNHKCIVACEFWVLVRTECLFQHLAGHYRVLPIF